MSESAPSGGAPAPGVAQLEPRPQTRAARVDARTVEATRPLLGLAPYRRVLAAAHAAGCAPLLLSAVAGQGQALLDACAGDPRLKDARIELEPPPLAMTQAEAEATDPAVLELDGAAIYDAAAVQALLAGDDPSAGLYVHADASDAEKRRRLLRALSSSQDGLVDTHLNRHLSRLMSRVLAGRISPNAATLISAVLGLLGVAGIASRQFWLGVAGALVLQLSAAVDCVDGELARLTHSSSPLGARLDLVCDNVVHLFLFVAMAWASVPLLGLEAAAAAGAAAFVGGLVSFAIVYWLNFRRASGPSSGLRRILDRVTNRDFTLIVLAAAAFGRWDLLIVLIAAGSNLFWIFLLAASLRAPREP